MGKIGLRRAGALLNDLAEPAAAVALRKAQRQPGKMLRNGEPQVRRHAEGRQMGAQQRADIDEIRQRCKQHRHPAVMRDVDRPGIIRRGIQHIAQDHPDVQKRDQRHQRAQGRQDPGDIGKDPIRPGILHQPRQIRSFLQGGSPPFFEIVNRGFQRTRRKTGALCFLFTPLRSGSPSRTARSRSSWSPDRSPRRSQRRSSRHNCPRTNSAGH